MGSGKTTVGRLLAAGLATKHADLDDLIVQRAGRSITTIFAEQGGGTSGNWSIRLCSKHSKHPGFYRPVVVLRPLQ
nr:shikimate kinase [Lactiplantibacillus plantarum]